MSAGVIVNVVAGEHHKKTPKFDKIHKDTCEVLLNAICLNSGYTSRVMVSIIKRLTLRSSL